MNRNSRIALGLFGVLLAGTFTVTYLPSVVRAEEKAAKEEKNEHEEKIAIDKLPQAVTDAVKAAMPDGKITEAEKENKDGKTVYSLDVESKGKTFDVSVSEAGKVLSTEEEKEEKGEKKD